MHHTGRVAGALLAATLLAATGCAEDKAPARGSRTPPASATSAPTSLSPSPTASPWTSFTGPLERCGPQPASVVSEPFVPTTLRDPAVGRIPAVRLGEGRVVLVLLHQTDGNGFCGWLPFMPVAAEQGIATLAIDLCRYGRSSCRAVSQGRFTDADQTDPVALAVGYARERMHARRIVVVGASMGGSVALMSGATLDGVDAVVDLSGPVEWSGMDVVLRGRALRVPALVAMATSEGPEEAAGAREIVANAPAGSTLLTPETGHGYELLNDVDGAVLPLASDVLAWIGEHTGAPAG